MSFIAQKSRNHVEDPISASQIKCKKTTIPQGVPKKYSSEEE